MKYLTPTPNPSGAYPAPQSNPFKDAIPLTDEQAETVVDYNGFVTITSHEEEYEEGFFRTVYTVEPNTEAWEAWKESLPPEPEPEPEPEYVTYAELAKAIREGVNAV
ncbi:MAG: hypothetical protein ACLTAZ_07350 [Dysosmobacter welbionis]|uniref:hypothetical protein n=1 Tax=Dysosmobacter welbionis TaxID=2093857 RepID=UPI003991442B